MKKKIVGITGSTGILGSNILRNNKKDFIFKRFKGNIAKRSDVFKWIKNNNFEYILHLAAKVPVSFVEKNYDLSLRINFDGTKNIVDAINFYKKEIKWFFFSSSAQVYTFSNTKIKETSKTRGISKYGRTKLMAEKYITKKLNKKVKFCIGRIFSFTDIKQDMSYFIPSIHNKIKKSKKLFVTENLSQKRDFIHIKDLSRAIIFLLKKNFNNIINIGSGHRTELNMIMKYFARKYKKKILIKKISKNIKGNLCPDITRLKRTGFNCKYTINNVLNDFIKS